MYSKTEKGQTIQTLYMPLGTNDSTNQKNYNNNSKNNTTINHELFQYDVQQERLMSNHTGWVTCPCTPIHVASNDGRIFRRFLMLISHRNPKVNLILYNLFYIVYFCL